MSALTEFERFKEKVVGKIDAQRGQCWLFHQWARWEDASSGQIVRTHDQKAIGTFLTQYRRCRRCNIAQNRSIKNTLLDAT